MICNSSQAIQFSYIYIHQGRLYHWLGRHSWMQPYATGSYWNVLAQPDPQADQPPFSKVTCCFQETRRTVAKGTQQETCTEAKDHEGKRESQGKGKSGPKEWADWVLQGKTEVLGKPRETSQNIDWGVLLVVGNSYAAALFGLQFGGAQPPNSHFNKWPWKPFFGTPNPTLGHLVKKLGKALGVTGVHLRISDFNRKKQEELPLVKNMVVPWSPMDNFNFTGCIFPKKRYIYSLWQKMRHKSLKDSLLVSSYRSWCYFGSKVEAKWCL